MSKSAFHSKITLLENREECLNSSQIYDNYTLRLLHHHHLQTSLPDPSPPPPPQPLTGDLKQNQSFPDLLQHTTYSQETTTSYSTTSSSQINNQDSLEISGQPALHHRTGLPEPSSVRRTSTHEQSRGRGGGAKGGGFAPTLRRSASTVSDIQRYF